MLPFGNRREVRCDRTVEAIGRELQQQRDRERFGDAANREIRIRIDRNSRSDIGIAECLLPFRIARITNADQRTRDVELRHHAFARQRGIAWRATSCRR
jgi:hypothetical protein